MRRFNPSAAHSVMSFKAIVDSTAASNACSVRGPCAADGFVRNDKPSGEAHRDAIVLHLVVPAELVGQLVPGCRDVVGALLCGLLARERLLQFILGDAVVLEDAGMRGSIAEFGWLYDVDCESM